MSSVTEHVVTNLVGRPTKLVTPKSLNYSVFDLMGLSSDEMNFISELDNKMLKQEERWVLVPSTIPIQKIGDFGCSRLRVTNEAGPQVAYDFWKFHNAENDDVDNVALRNCDNFVPHFSPNSSQYPSPLEQDSKILGEDDHHHYRQNGGEVQASKGREEKTNEIMYWAEEICEIQEKFKNCPTFYREAMQVVNRAHLLTQGHLLPDNQMMECLSILNCLWEKEDKKKEDHNRKDREGQLTAKGQGKLQRVVTGIEKSSIIAIVATIRALQGDQVEIFTSNPILAEREAKKWKHFYEYFGLHCAGPSFSYAENEVVGPFQIMQNNKLQETPKNGRVLRIFETMTDEWLPPGTVIGQKMYKIFFEHQGHENENLRVVPSNGIIFDTNLEGRGTDRNMFKQTKLKTQDEFVYGLLNILLRIMVHSQAQATDPTSRKEIESSTWTSGNLKNDGHKMVGGKYISMNSEMVQKPTAPSFYQLNSSERRHSTGQINGHSEPLVDYQNSIFNLKFRNGHPYFMGETTTNESKKVINSMKEFEAVENLIERDGDARQNLARNLHREMSKLSSPTLGSHVRKGLNALFSLKLANQFNWKGRLGKKSFRWTEIQRVLFVAVQTKFFEVTDYEIEKPVKKWFKREGLMYEKKMKAKGSAKKMRRQKMARTAARMTAANTASHHGWMRSVQRNFGQRRRGGSLIGRKMARTFGGKYGCGQYGCGQYGKQR